MEEQQIKEYIERNLTITVWTNTAYEGCRKFVDVTVKLWLEGKEISCDTNSVLICEE